MAGNSQSRGRMTTRVSLAELAAADIRLRPAEAVAIVSRDLPPATPRGELRGIPSPGVIRLTRDGDDRRRRSDARRDQAAVPAAGAAAVRPAAGLRRRAELSAPAAGCGSCIARALGTLDLPPYATIDEFCAALDRFAAPDLHAIVRRLFRSWERAGREARTQASPELTISDVRRARRATGLTLEEIAAAAEVPAARAARARMGLLRATGRARRRARADRAATRAPPGSTKIVVLSIAWPLIEEAAAAFADADRRRRPAWCRCPHRSRLCRVRRRRRDAHRSLAAVALAGVAAHPAADDRRRLRWCASGARQPPPIAQTSTVMTERRGPGCPTVEPRR